jgi:hypothetical protein
LYDGQFPHPSTARNGLRAVRESCHFTQSAGLVAIHPIADALAEEFAIFAWRLRAEAFCRFGYDPEGAFSNEPNEYGFPNGPVKIWHTTVPS